MTNPRSIEYMTDISDDTGWFGCRQNLALSDVSYTVSLLNPIWGSLYETTLGDPHDYSHRYVRHCQSGHRDDQR